MSPDCFVTCLPDRSRTHRDDHVNLEANQLRGKLRQTLESTLSVTSLEHEPLVLQPSPRSHASEKRRNNDRWHYPRSRRRRGNKQPDSVNLPRRLRLGGERRGEEAERASEEATPIHYSIT